jgi:copper resistance protein C
VAVAAPARAHTYLVGSDPEDDEVLEAPVNAIVLEFNEPVRERFAEVAVTAPDGEHVEVGPPEVDTDQVTQPVALDQAAEHIVAYRVLAADDHPVTGEIRFEVRQAALDEPPAPDPDRAPAADREADDPGLDGTEPEGTSDVAPPDSEDDQASAVAAPDPAPGTGEGAGAVAWWALLAVLAAGFVAAVWDGLRRAPRTVSEAAETP